MTISKVNMFSNLPQDALTQIVSHLPTRSRESLFRSNLYLSNTFSPLNQSIWNDLHRIRYPNFHPTSVPIADYRRKVLLCDAALDYFLVSSPTFHTTHTSSQSSPPRSFTPCISVTNTSLYVTHCDQLVEYSTQQFIHSPPIYSGTSNTLESNASCIKVLNDVIAIGLSNGAVYLKRNHLDPKILRGHQLQVSALELTPQLIISGSKGREIRIRSITSRRSLALLRGHASPIEWLHVPESSPNILFSHAGSDSRLKLWDIPTARCINTARLSSRIIAAVASPPSADIIYAATSQHVSLLDRRMGLDRTAALLYLPSSSSWSNGQIHSLSLASDGTLAAAVGASAVALWDATGPWEARGLGWPLRFINDHSKRLRTVHVSSRTVFAGGGAAELLVLAQDGSAAQLFGPSSPQSTHKAAITHLTDINDQHGILVARKSGLVEFATVENDKVDWNKANSIVGTQLGEEAGFWNSGNS